MSELDEAIIPKHILHGTGSIPKHILHGTGRSSELNSLKYWLSLRNWYDDYMRKNNLTPKTLSSPDRACYETVQACIAREVQRKLKQE